MPDISADGYSVNVHMDHKEFEKLVNYNENIKMEDKWIYESPDKGKTVYRRRLNAPHEERELYNKEKSKHYYDYDRNGRKTNPFIPTSELEKIWTEMESIEPLTPGGVKNSWIVDVNTDYSINLPKSLLQELNCEEGDVLEWGTGVDGNITLKLYSKSSIK